MLDETKKSEFLRLGLERYPDARDTVDYFQTSITDAILAAFVEKTSWKNFAPKRDSTGNFENGKVTGSGDRYIQGWVAGTLPHVASSKDRVWLSLGLYWKPKYASASVVAFSSAWTEKGASVPFVDVLGRDVSVKLGALSKKSERRLYLVPDANFEIAEAFLTLLNCADDALSGSA